MADDYNQYYAEQGLVFDPNQNQYVKPSYTEPSSPEEIAAYRTFKSVKHEKSLPVNDDRYKYFGPDDPDRPSYIMEPNLLEAQQGMTLPTGVYQDAGGGLFYRDNNEPVPIVKRPGLLPIAQTPEGVKFVAPKLLDLVGNVMAPLAAGRVPIQAGEMVLGSGMVKTAKSTDTPITIYRGEYSGNKGGKFWSPDFDFTKQFTQSGQDHEVLKRTIKPSEIYKAEHIYAGNPDEVDKVLAEAKSKGFKAVELNEGSGQPNSIRFLSDTRNQVASQVADKVEKAEPFYSALERAVSGAKVEKAGAEQWLGYLRNQPGVKAEELSTVLKELPEGQISKAQLEDLVKQNKVELKETVKGKYDSGKIDDRVYHRDLDNIAVRDFGKLYDHIADSEQQIVRQKALERQNQNPTKYHSYQLPGGENYKEMLLQLPEKTSELHLAQKRYAELMKKSNWSDSELKELDDIGDKFRNARSKGLPEDSSELNYKSSHWDEPNILAHIRMNDRTIEGKKVLHLEEIQSDWHQAGRKQGYKLNEGQKKELEGIDEKLMNGLDEKTIGNPDIKSVLKTAVDQKVITADEASKYESYSKGENSKIPDAPFKKNWDELALKRMIRHASENGYEGLSWTPGEAQAARYDLSKQLDSLKVYKDESDNFKIYGKKSGGREFEHLASDVSPQKLEDTVGKEVAQKIIDRNKNTKPYEPITELPEGYRLIHDSNGKKSGQEWGILPPNQSHAQSYTGRYHATEKEAKDAALERMNGEARHIYDTKNSTYENVDLKIGGEGMKSFYDKMLVDRANALGKKYGVKVEQKEIENNKEGWHLTPPDQTTHGGWMVKSNDYNSQGTRFSPNAKGEAEAREFLKQRIKMQSIHYLPITPQLRNKAMQEGFPLFSASPTYIPVDKPPELEKKYKLIPVENPFK